MSSVLSVGFQIQGNSSSEKIDCVGRVLLPLHFPRHSSNTVTFPSVALSPLEPSFRDSKALLVPPYLLVKNLTFGKTLLFLIIQCESSMGL